LLSSKLKGDNVKHILFQQCILVGSYHHICTYSS